MWHRLLLMVAFGCSSLANAQVFVKPVGAAGKDMATFGGYFASTSSEYKHKIGDTRVKRQVIGIDASYSDMQDFDLLAQVAFVVESAFDGVRTVEDGDGFNFGGGLKGMFWHSDVLHAGAFSMLTYQSESFTGTSSGIPYEIDFSMLELHAGSGLLYDLSSVVKTYLALGVVAYNDGAYTESINKQPQTEAGFSRKNIVYTKLGVVFVIEDIEIRPEVGLLGEQSFELAISGTF